MFDDGPPPISPVKAKKEKSVSKTSTTTTRSTKSKPKPSSVPPLAPTDHDEEDASDFNKSDHVRGYKVSDFNAAQFSAKTFRPWVHFWPLFLTSSNVHPCRSSFDLVAYPPHSPCTHR